MTDWTPERIRALRDRLGLTQVEAAQRCGVSQATWARWESGETTPTHWVAIAGLETMDHWRKRSLNNEQRSKDDDPKNHEKQ